MHIDQVNAKSPEPRGNTSIKLPCWHFNGKVVDRYYKFPPPTRCMSHPKMPNTGRDREGGVNKTPPGGKVRLLKRKEKEKRKGEKKEKEQRRSHENRPRQTQGHGVKEKKGKARRNSGKAGTAEKGEKRKREEKNHKGPAAPQMQRAQKQLVSTTPPVLVLVTTKRWLSNKINVPEAQAQLHISGPKWGGGGKIPGKMEGRGRGGEVEREGKGVQPQAHR